MPRISLSSGQQTHLIATRKVLNSTTGCDSTGNGSVSKPVLPVIEDVSFDSLLEVNGWKKLDSSSWLLSLSASTESYSVKSLVAGLSSRLPMASRSGRTELLFVCGEGVCRLFESEDGSDSGKSCFLSSTCFLSSKSQLLMRLDVKQGEDLLSLDCLENLILALEPGAEVGLLLRKTSQQILPAADLAPPRGYSDFTKSSSPEFQPVSTLCMPALIAELAGLSESDCESGNARPYLSFIDQLLEKAKVDSEQETCYGIYQPLSPALMLARSWMLENIHQALDNEELARVCRVSMRSLYNLFHRELQQTPGNYFRALKLESARQDLLNNRARSVTECAVDYGFSNLGRFSRQYRQQVGELPSHTLRRGRACSDAGLTGQPESLHNLVFGP